MECPLCGVVEETVAHFVTECVVLVLLSAGGGEGAVWSNPGAWRDSGGGVGGDTALQREDT